MSPGSVPRDFKSSRLEVEQAASEGTVLGITAIRHSRRSVGDEPKKTKLINLNQERARCDSKLVRS